MDFNKYTRATQNALTETQQLARARNHNGIEAEHLIYMLLGNDTIRQVLVRSNQNINSLKLLLEQQLSKLPVAQPTPTNKNNTFLTPKLLLLLDAAEKSVAKSGEKLVDVQHIFRAWLVSKSPAATVMRDLGVRPEAFEAQVVGSRGASTGEKSKDGESALSKYCVELVGRAGQRDIVVGREVELGKLVQVLLAHGKSSAALVGKPGTGKKSIVYKLAQAIASGAVQAQLQNKLIYSLDLGSVLSGSSLRGQAEEKFLSIFREIRDTNKQAILFVANIDQMMGAGGDNSSDASSLLKTALANGDVQVIGTASDDAYRNRIEKDKSLARWFQPIQVREPTFDETLDILKGIRSSHELHHGISIADEALSAAIKFSKRFYTEAQLPDQAISIVDLASSRLRTMGSDRKELTAEDIALFVGADVNVPVASLLESEREKLLKMEGWLQERVSGQREAIGLISTAIKRSRAGLSGSLRPSSFICLGATGVGKTYIAKLLASYLFGEKQSSFVRLDMSEYRDASSQARLLGSTFGYKDSEQGGVFETVRKNPFCVVLFDEIEKGSKEVLTLLLQILDEGTVTDSQNRKISFADCVIILTTNLGAKDLAPSSADGIVSDEMREASMRALQGFLPPELIARCSAVIPYHSLTRHDINTIATLQFKELHKMLVERKITLQLSKEVEEYIQDISFVPALGARPTRNNIEKFIQNPMAEALLAGGFGPDDTIAADLVDGKIVFTKQ